MSGKLPGRRSLALAVSLAALWSPSALLAAPSATKPVAGAEATTAADPVALEVATRIAGRILPDGTFQKVMDASISQMSKSMMDSMLAMPLNSLAQAMGQDPAKLKALGSAKLSDVLQVMDPAFGVRTERSMRVMASEMGRLMTAMEPSFRQGLAEAYVGQFQLAELREIDAFFQTPAGRAFAERSMTIQTDPAFQSRMQQLIPSMMKAMPQIMKKIAEQTADLPAPKKPQDLTPAERERLAILLGLDPAEMK
ncbi:MAG: DUF2059 domain-containing protein [Pseudomonadota bacterium]|uniref:DUF2059 domain-containing protein n=1 Tax=Rhizorhabdus phycosphaerae TaxID=2711156 RepID=UPI0013ED17DF|nr:DUF2059 domain-containing protein [Rhizorhabdus phycosphaerae]